MGLYKSFSEYDSEIQKATIQYSGLLGLTIGGSKVVNLPSRAGYVYVRLRDNQSEVIQAYNDKVSPVYDFPVLVQRLGNRWIVAGKDTQRYETFGTSAPFLPAHGSQHSFNRDLGTGADTVWVHADQFMPLLVYPSGSAGAGNLMVAPYLLQRDSDFVYVGNTGTPNLLVYKPTNNQAIMGLVCINTDTGNPDILIASGTPMGAVSTGTSYIANYLPFPSTNQQPLYAFRLVSGTSRITWDNLYNARQFYGGNSGGGNVTGTATPGGNNTEVQYNSSGTFTGDPQFTWRNATKSLGIGDPSKFPFSFEKMLWMVGDGESPSIFGLAYGSDRAPFITFAKGDGTATGTTNVKLDQVIGRIRGRGYDGYDWSNTQAEVRIVADGNWGTGNHPTRLEFWTTPSGTSTMALAATITDDGHIDIASGKEYRVNGVQHTHATESFAIKNTSGATANTGDVGYINEAGEYKTTTTAQDSVKWCVVITGGADNADIYVARRGRVTVNYTGTAPSAGHYLSTSTSAGLAQRETAMHPAIFAVCTAAGSGGTVEVQLLCLTVFRPLVKSTDILRINSLSRTDFVATINGTPGATHLVYNAPSSGNENTIVPASSSEVGNLVCFNTTRGTSALVDSVNIGTNTITFVTAPPAGSANGDTITFRSQTYPSALQTGIYLYEIDLTGCNLTLARSVALSCQAHDTGTIGGNVFAFIHKLSASAGFASGISWIADWSHIIVPAVELVNNKIMFAVGASGTGTMNYFIVRLNGVWEAVP